MPTKTPTPAQAPDHLIRPEPAERDALLELERQLETMLSKGERTARLAGSHGEEVELPASAFHALQLLADGMAKGLTMMLLPQSKELTTQQAADILHVSRPHLIKLLDQGRMPFHQVGTHRRIRIEDLLAYREKRNQHRREQLEELTHISEQLPGGYE
jgi:excisionase family DNA binding protein